MNHFMRQIEEKNVAHEIEILLWSDRMDLVALANSKGEVALHRLTWSRAWCLSPLKEGDLVRGLSWRPDGKVLAIGYQSGIVLLVSVENKAILHSFEVDGEISCIHWAQEAIDNKSPSKNLINPEESNEYVKFLDFGNVFLPNLEGSNFNSTSQDTDVSNLFKNQKELNLLLVGTKIGLLYISIFGCLLPIQVNVSKLVGGRCCIQNVYMSENLNMIFANIIDEFDSIKLAFINSDIFKSHRKELFATAVKYENLNSLLNNISTTVSNIKEHWESIFLEMDSKLSKFASKVPEGTLSADFLDLLMFGICTNEMQEFLLHDLTKKGLEKFGQTIEMSYGNIHKLLLKNFSKAGQSIAYHLLDLRGMSRLEHRYKVLGLEEEKITTALAANGAFLVKGGEMQQIITHSGISYKAFFRWLYTAILHLMEETIPPEIQKGTQQDIAIVSEFLLNFDEIGNTKKTENPSGGFIMERLGQYLADSPLTVPSRMENEWEKHLAQVECLKEHSKLILHFRDKSLVQQFNILKDALSDIFIKPAEMIGQHISHNIILQCDGITNKNTQISYINNGSENLYVTVIDTEAPNLYFLDCRLSNNPIKTFGVSLTFEQSGEAYDIIDVKFYSNSILSVLLQDSKQVCYLVQCPLPKILESLQEVAVGPSGFTRDAFVVHNACQLADVTVNCIPQFKSERFAISGSRKVSIVLSDTRRKVRLYEMEVDEEDDEENDLTVSTMRESDNSAQDISDGD